MTQRIKSTLSKHMFFLIIASLSFSVLSADSGLNNSLHNSLDKIVEKKTVLDFEDVFKLEYAASVEFHPKQEMFVYERRSMDIMTDTTKIQLWSYDLKSKQHLPLLADGASYYSPKFSSDGSRLAYLSPQNGTPQIFVKWMNNDRSAKISDLRSSPSNLS